MRHVQLSQNVGDAAPEPELESLADTQAMIRRMTMRTMYPSNRKGHMMSDAIFKQSIRRLRLFRAGGRQLAAEQGSSFL